MPTPPQNLKQFSALVQLIADLRGPEGCPWDREQDHLTLAPYAIEETFEMVEALESQNDNDICEELGDVLFQVVLHAQLGAERKAFDIDDVIKTINEKLVRRHPHVFANVKVSGKEEILINWDLIKKQEKSIKPQSKEQDLAKKIFKAPMTMPALQSSDSIGEKSNKYKFDWSNTFDVLTQLKSEIAELEQAMKNPQDQAHLQHEIGDVLFSAAQLCRHLGFDSETTLRQANRRFIKRFVHMVQNTNCDVEKFSSLTNEEKENLWKKAKTED